MEFIAFLNTTNEFDNDDVVVAFHELLSLGLESLKNGNYELSAKIVEEFMTNEPCITQEN
jgi:hypothetical protein